MSNNRYKFRAWDKEKRENGMMVYPGKADVIILSNNGVFIDSEKYIVMQYVGLSDKNGKEIYESDIVKDENDRIHLVMWNGVFYGFQLNNIASGCSFCIDGSSLEIIGNQFESPQLLKNN